MKTINSDMKSAAAMKHIIGTKVQTSDSDKNGDSRSGVRNIFCQVISFKDKFVAGINMLINTFTEYHSESKSDQSKFIRWTIFKGRELYMRTGDSSGTFRNSSAFSGSISWFSGRITEVSGSFSDVIRSFVKFIRCISILPVSFPGTPEKYAGLVRENSGLFFQLPETNKGLPELLTDSSGSFKVSSELFRRFPGLFRSLPAESGDEQ